MHGTNCDAGMDGTMDPKPWDKREIKAMRILDSNARIEVNNVTTETRDSIDRGHEAICDKHEIKWHKDSGFNAAGDFGPFWD